MKILNLYAGIGGNRKLWGEEHDITAVEFNEEIAMIYKDLFPNDNVIIADAHQYLLDHYMEFDFIWSSPPCPTHSRMRYTCTKQDQKTREKLEVKYVDMKLYQEIILLDKYFEGKYVVENVIPYYTPLIPAKKLGRHLFWSNFNIGSFEKKTKSIRGNSMSVLQDQRGFDLSKYKIKHRKDTILLNCVDSELALYILECALNIIPKNDLTQIQLF
nr:DNA cytosine methyltransferase [uncultured Flavobacterium sp.]